MAENMFYVAFLAVTISCFADVMLLLCKQTLEHVNPSTLAHADRHHAFCCYMCAAKVWCQTETADSATALADIPGDIMTILAAL
jgi:hypothetical protein